MENITAMVSCFARAYHTGANACPVFSDTAARALLGSDYEAIAQNMLEGMDFFLPDFRGTPEEGLRRVCGRPPWTFPAIWPTPPGRRCSWPPATGRKKRALEAFWA